MSNKTKKTIQEGGQEAKLGKHDIHNRHVPIKSPSKLQKAQSAAQWAINFSLQHFHSYTLSNAIPLSRETEILINTRNSLTTELQLAIRSDYNNYKEEVLLEREEQTTRVKLAKAKANE